MPRPRIQTRRLTVALASCFVVAAFSVPQPAAAGTFTGQFYRGDGDEEYLQLLDISRRMFEADPEFQNLPMLYTPAWNGFVEGPTWARGGSRTAMARRTRRCPSTGNRWSRSCKTPRICGSIYGCTSYSVRP